MCGIFGYIGTRTAEPIIVDGLRTLEYRGYDSAGIFIPGSGCVKAVGPIDNLSAKLGGILPGTSGIGHTRWATHGVPSEVNAHPHRDGSGHVWIVHNGIIENYAALKEELIQRGYTFSSDTDAPYLAMQCTKVVRRTVMLKDLLSIKIVNTTHSSRSYRSKIFRASRSPSKRASRSSSVVYGATLTRAVAESSSCS